MTNILFKKEFKFTGKLTQFHNQNRAHIPVYLQIKTGNLIFHSTYQYILVKGLCDYIYQKTLHSLE